MSQHQDKRAPVKVFRAGSIEAAVWEKDEQTRGGEPELEVRITRRYRDTKGWHHTTRFSPFELLSVAEVAKAAFRHLVVKERTPGQ